MFCVFFFQAEDGIRDWSVTGVQTCALPISRLSGLDHRERESQIGELAHFELGTVTNDACVGLEDAAGSEGVVRQPCGLVNVDDEPPVGRRRKTRVRLYEACLFDHSYTLGGVAGG